MSCVAHMCVSQTISTIWHSMSLWWWTEKGKKKKWASHVNVTARAYFDIQIKLSAECNKRNLHRKSSLEGIHIGIEVNVVHAKQRYLSIPLTSPITMLDYCYYLRFVNSLWTKQMHLFSTNMAAMSSTSLTNKSQIWMETAFVLYGDHPST